MNAMPDQSGAGSTPAVIVAGDALVDLTPTFTTRGTSAYEPHPGGSCLNVAVGLGRLGVPVSLLARISDDHFGALLRSHLAASGVLPSYLLPTSDVTALAAVPLEAGTTGYSFYSALAADRGLRPDDIAHLPDNGTLPAHTALHFGSIALVQEPQASTLVALMRREARRRLVSLDPNVRPTLIPDRSAYLRQLDEWVTLVDIVKVSDEDLEWLYPGEPHETVARRWLEAGVAMVLVTSGPRGAWAATRTARRQVPAPRIAVVDTVGAGDAFTSGMLAHLHRTGQLGRDAVSRLDEVALDHLLSEAIQVAADTCTRSGAEPPYRTELDDPPTPLDPSPMSMDGLVARARRLAGDGERRILGITGAPGAGKTTLAEAVVGALGKDLAVVVPMDGFHLANATLLALGRRDRKGAWDTFDADGYVALLRRLRSRTEAVVHAPRFDRDVDESIGSALPVNADIPLVVTEGNYLLSRRGAWAQVAALLDDTWYLHLDTAPRQERLVRRHQHHGMTREQAVAWADGTDEPNAELIATDAARANLFFRLESPAERDV